MSKKIFSALGIMNGTSVDAIDYALIQSSKNLDAIKFKKHKQFPIPKNLKTRLLQAASNELNTYEVSLLHFDLGRLYERHIKSLKKSWKWDVAGVHGQTVHHEGRVATFQIGHPGFIAKESSRPVVFDFRSNDLICGGQGAPFAPFFQKIIGSQLKQRNFAFHNLGGISNLTLFQSSASKAFDTGPANILLDQWIQKKKKLNFDRNGAIAAKGLPEPSLVEKFLTHPYFKKKAPKSCGREEFNFDFLKKYGGKSFEKLSIEDQMATLVDFTALSISKAYSQEFKKPPQTIYFYGGGVYNSFLMKRIQYYLPSTKLLTTDDILWPSQAFEASTFAFLALARFLGKKIHIPKVTGSKKRCHLGQIYSL